MSILRSIADLGPGCKAAIYAKGAFRCLPPTIQASIAICASLLGAWAARGLAGWDGIDLPGSELALICGSACMAPAMMRMACFAHVPNAPRQVTPAIERFSMLAALLGALSLLWSLSCCSPQQAARDALAHLAQERSMAERALALGLPAPTSESSYEGAPGAEPGNRELYMRDAIDRLDERADDTRRWIQRPTRSPTVITGFVHQTFAMAFIQGFALSCLLSLATMAWRRRALAWRALHDGSLAGAVAIREAALVFGWRILHAPANAAAWSSRALGSAKKKAPKARQIGELAAMRIALALRKAPGLPKAAAKQASRALRRCKARAAVARGRALQAWVRASERVHESIVAHGLGSAEELSKFEKNEIEDASGDPVAPPAEIKAKRPRL